MQHGVVAKFSRIKSSCSSKIEISLRVDKFPRLILRSPFGVFSEKPNYLKRYMYIAEGFQNQAATFTLLPDTSNLAYSRLANISSRSNSGWSSIISSVVISESNKSSTTSTGQRIPRMQGFPWQILGFIVILFAYFMFSKIQFFLVLCR